MSNDIGQTARELVSKIFGVQPTSVDQIRRGVMTHKFAVQMPNGHCYVVRFYPHGREHVVEYEPDLLRRSRAAGVGTPDVIADSRTGPRAEMHYVVYRLIHGTPLAERLDFLSGECLQQISGDLVARVSHLGRLPVTGYGELVKADRAQFESFDHFWIHSFSEGLEAAERSKIWSRETLGRLQSISLHRGITDEKVPSLAWGDLSTENILIDSNDRVSGLVDFEGVIAAEELLNLGYAYARYHGTALFQSLVAAWPHPLKQSHWRAIYHFCLLRAVRLARFSTEPLPTGYPRVPIEDLLPGIAPAIRALATE